MVNQPEQPAIKRAGRRLLLLALNLKIPELAEVVEGAEADPTVVQSFVLGSDNRLLHVVKEDCDHAGRGVVDEFEAVPTTRLPRCALGAGGGDRSAVGMVD